eukprot:1195465-Prorocentrum_minimum.AAC.6
MAVTITAESTGNQTVTTSEKNSTGSMDECCLRGLFLLPGSLGVFYVLLRLFQSVSLSRNLTGSTHPYLYAVLKTIL